MNIFLHLLVTYYHCFRGNIITVFPHVVRTCFTLKYSHFDAAETTDICIKNSFRHPFTTKSVLTGQYLPLFKSAHV